MDETRPNVVLIGFMGAGKSTIAAALARSRGMEAIETDETIARREGMSIPDIFKHRGEAHFRDAETALLAELVGRRGIVVSCGGGMPLRAENAEMMRRIGTVVLLSASPQTVLHRVGSSTDRPLLDGRRTPEAIAELMEARRERYEAAADVTVATDGRSADDICREIARIVGIDEGDD